MWWKDLRGVWFVRCEVKLRDSARLNGWERCWRSRSHSGPCDFDMRVAIPVD